MARNRATTRVTHTHGARVSRVRNEFEGCAGCVRIAMVGHVCTRGSSSLPLGSLSSGAIVAYVENDTFRIARPVYARERVESVHNRTRDTHV